MITAALMAVLAVPTYWLLSDRSPDRPTLVLGTEDDRPDPAEIACVEAALTQDEDIISGAVDYRPGPGKVNHSWAEAADNLKQIPLVDCPRTFISAFAAYTAAVSDYGSFLEDRTGLAALDDVFDSGSASKRDRLVGTINRRFDAVRVHASELGVSSSPRQLIEK